jgi:AraC family L-rhamnose operon regulatory protein RhaS
MTILHGNDFFSGGQHAIAIEPRAPQSPFPEHHHDFYEIVIVEHGNGVHLFNGQPYTLSTGSVCFVRAQDRHQFELTDNLCLTNVLYRAPDEFSFLTGLDRLLPQEQAGHYASHWRVNQPVLQQVQLLLAQLQVMPLGDELSHVANRELLFMQLVMLLRQAALSPADGNELPHDRLNNLMTWLEEHSTEEVCWEQLADQFTLSLRTLHRQLKQHTGMTPQRYLNRLRLTKARHLLLHSDDSVTEIAFSCGFGDSNHFSTLFKREFSYSPRTVRQGFNS